jgi:hypothetical protein
MFDGCIEGIGGVVGGMVLEDGALSLSTGKVKSIWSRENILHRNLVGEDHRNTYAE